MHFVRHDNSINSIIPSDKPKFDSVYIAGMQSIAFKLYTFHRTGKNKLNVDHFNTNIYDIWVTKAEIGDRELCLASFFSAGGGGGGGGSLIIRLSCVDYLWERNITPF